MTSFVVSSYPTEHPGVARLQAAAEGWTELRRRLSGGRGLATALLAGLAAAVLVVAFQVMDSLAEGHLLVIWMGAWLAGFAALALLAAPSRQLASLLIRSVGGRLQRLAEQRADERMWALACQDSRVMSDLMIATQRDLDQPASAR
ncbi:MAG: hypothetical protein WCK08_14230 [Betaproteobacteria bacterium]|jgi:hypothetical protein